MNFKNMIIKENDELNYRRQFLSKLRDSAVPNYIYGAGYVSSIIISGFKKEKIHTDGVFVDSEYQISQDYMGVPMFSINDRRLLNKCNIILGFIAPSIDYIESKLSSVLVYNVGGVKRSIIY